MTRTVSVRSDSLLTTDSVLQDGRFVPVLDVQRDLLPDRREFFTVTTENGDFTTLPEHVWDCKVGA